MGIDVNALKFLSSSGADFSRTVMVGRHRLYVSPEAIHQLVPNAAAPLYGAAYAEWVLQGLGAEKVDSVDVSSYEGATILHDMNLPLPEVHRGKYTALVECGTLEHVFNFPVAIRNCMELLEVGGRLLCCTVANNFCGHGFYQFSPELFFRVLSPTNGFEMERFIACDAHYESEWYAVADPAEVRTRVAIGGPYPAMLMVQARKTADRPFQTPQQSDYVAAWSSGAHADHALAPAWLGLRRWLWCQLRAVRSPRQYRAPFFQRISK